MKVSKGKSKNVLPPAIINKGDTSFTGLAGQGVDIENYFELQEKRPPKLFNKGQALKGGLINGSAVINSVFASKNNEIFGPNSDMNRILSDNPNSATTQNHAKNQWKQAMKLLQMNPALLMDTVPSPKRRGKKQMDMFADMN